MPRKPREIVPNCPHHITQRTIRRLPLFQSDSDRRKYCEILHQERSRFGVKIWAYCLMDNHIHLVAEPPSEKALSLMMRNAHSRYALYFNARHGFLGHLMQSRYYSCPMDERHMWSTIRYVERNPVEAGIVDHAADYEWSSAPVHCGMMDEDRLVDLDLPNGGFVDNWYDWLDEYESIDMIRRIVNATIDGTWLGHRAPSPNVVGT